MVEISTLCAPCFNSSPTHRWTLNTQYSEDWKKQGIFIVQFSLISQSEINPYSCVANIKTRLQTRMPTPPKPAGVNLSENSAHTFSQRWLNGLLSTYRDLNPITTGKICKPETLHEKGVFRRQKITISPHLQLQLDESNLKTFLNVFKQNRCECKRFDQNLFTCCSAWPAHCLFVYALSGERLDGPTI